MRGLCYEATHLISERSFQVRSRNGVHVILFVAAESDWPVVFRNRNSPQEIWRQHEWGREGGRTRARQANSLLRGGCASLLLNTRGLGAGTTYLVLSCHPPPSLAHPVVEIRIRYSTLPCCPNATLHSFLVSRLLSHRRANRRDCRSEDDATSSFIGSPASGPCSPCARRHESPHSPSRCKCFPNPPWSSTSSLFLGDHNHIRFCIDFATTARRETTGAPTNTSRSAHTRRRSRQTLVP